MGAHPDFLKNNPVPTPKQRLYNGQKLIVWEGKVQISSISGWIDNPRIELAKKRLSQTIGSRPLTQVEVFDLMKNDPDIKLNDLRNDILKNGLREPLTLSYDGKLLDGNRRFFAVKYALESMGSIDPNRKDLETVDAFVLAQDATIDDEQHVLVEENFSASLKLEWPDYVKATKIVDAHNDGLSIDQIAKKFDWNKSKVRETLRINEIIQEFNVYATTDRDLEDENGGGLGYSENDAEALAAKNYQFFNEAQKSFFDPLKTDFDFKIQFFKWINDGKFSSFPEVRVAFRAWKNPEAKAALMQPEPSAAKSAKAILDYNDRIVRSTEEASGRIESFVKFLNEMSVHEVRALPESSGRKLQEALEVFIRMNRAASAEE
jgi:hypothetical protein